MLNLPKMMGRLSVVERKMVAYRLESSGNEENL
jgi:hypothetical protein